MSRKRLLSAEKGLEAQKRIIRTQLAIPKRGDTKLLFMVSNSSFKPVDVVA